MISRKLILAGAAILALSGVAQAQNTVTTTQIGVVNSSTTNQSGGFFNAASLTQLGVVNSGSATQTSGGLNLSNIGQIGVHNSASVGQAGFANGSAINQLSFFGSNSAAIGQAGVFNSSTANQTHIP